MRTSPRPSGEPALDHVSGRPSAKAGLDEPQVGVIVRMNDRGGPHTPKLASCCTFRRIAGVYHASSPTPHTLLHLHKSMRQRT